MVTGGRHLPCLTRRRGLLLTIACLTTCAWRRKKYWPPTCRSGWLQGLRQEGRPDWFRATRSCGWPTWMAHVVNSLYAFAFYRLQQSFLHAEIRASTAYGERG